VSEELDLPTIWVRFDRDEEKGCWTSWMVFRGGPHDDGFGAVEDSGPDGQTKEEIIAAIRQEYPDYLVVPGDADD